jgi:hypothetical protein
VSWLAHRLDGVQLAVFPAHNHYGPHTRTHAHTHTHTHTRTKKNHFAHTNPNLPRTPGTTPASRAFARVLLRLETRGAHVPQSGAYTALSHTRRVWVSTNIPMACGTKFVIFHAASDHAFSVTLATTPLAFRLLQERSGQAVHVPKPLAGVTLQQPLLCVVENIDLVAHTTRPDTPRAEPGSLRY